MTLKQSCILVLGLGVATNTMASDIKLRGFASFVGGSTLSSDEALYNYEDTLNFRQDSLMALQVDAPLGDKLSATMQVIGRGANEYEPVMEWAYATYRFNDNLQLSAGRIRVPFYRYSDFIDVHYAYNWLKVPQTVYGFDFPGFDGLSMVYNNSFGSWDSSVQVIYGQLEGKVNGYDGILNDLTGFSWTMSYDWLTLRAGYVQAKVTISGLGSEALVEGIKGLDASPLVPFDLQPLADAFNLFEDDGAFGGLALGIDYNNVLLDIEYISYETKDSLLGKTDAYYVAFGYRWDKWVPLITYSQQKDTPPTDLLNKIPNGAGNLPFGPASLGAVLGGAIESTRGEVDLIDVGVRYDFQNSAALKIFWTQVDNRLASKNQLLRFGIDLVF